MGSRRQEGSNEGSQSMFSWQNNKNHGKLSLLSLTLKVPVMTAADGNIKYFFSVFQRKLDMIFQVNPLLGRGFSCNIMPYFLQKITMKKIAMSSAAILLGTIRVYAWNSGLRTWNTTSWQEKSTLVSTHSISYLKTNISFWVLSKIDYSAGSSCSLWQFLNKLISFQT